MFSYLREKFGKLFDALKGITVLDEKNMEIVLNTTRDILVSADVPFLVVNEFLNQLKQDCLGVRLPAAMRADEYIAKKVYDYVVSLFGGEKSNKKDHLISFLQENASRTVVIAVGGLQGAGKTTTIAKIIHHIKRAGIPAAQIATASLDFKRPAAIAQLRIVAQEEGVTPYEQSQDTVIEGPLAGKNYKERARNEKKRVLILDTAGRISLDTVLMEELKSIWHTVTPDIGLLVVDIMTGQGGLAIAESFSTLVPFQGVILTKVDSDAPGGIALGIVKQLHLPLWYVTQGEKKEDFELFNPVRITKKILGMGDFLSLAELATKKLAVHDEEVMKKAIAKGDITIDEFVTIIKMIQKMGPMKQIMHTMPRDMVGNVNAQQIDQMEAMQKKFCYLRDSMTKKERNACELISLTPSRKKRVAKGAGLSGDEVEKLLEMYHKAKGGLKMFKKFAKFL